MRHQMMGEAGDVDDEDQREEQIQPRRRAALGHPPVVTRAFGQGVRSWVPPVRPSPPMSMGKVARHRWHLRVQPRYAYRNAEHV